jgi:hypothetical protein
VLRGLTAGEDCRDGGFHMTSKTQALKIVRTVVGVGAGLIYFLYSKNSPPMVGWLITLAVVFFAILSRRSGVYAKNS